jgi:hypothetical protein
MSRTPLAAVLVLAAVACGKSDKPAAGTGSAATASGSAAGATPGSAAATAPTPTPIPPGAVAIFVDDQQVAVVDKAALDAWPRVDALVPQSAQRLGVWEAIAVTGAAPLELKSPADQFPGLVPGLYPTPDGPAFGMFDLVDLTRRKPPTRGTATAVREVRIKLAADSDRGMNEEGSKAAFDPKTLQIAIEGGTKPMLTGEEIIELPREAPPNGDTNTQGWKLTTFLAAGGITKFKKLLLSDAAGTTLTLTPAELDPARSVPFFKLNRQGQLRLRLYTKEGDGWVLGGNLRGLTSIKVLE